MVSYVNIIAFAWLGYLASKATRACMSGSRSTVDFVFPVHFFFCGMPLLLDTCLGVPEYNLFPGFGWAAADARTCIIYAIYVAICPMIWLWVGKTQGSPTSPSRMQGPPKRRQLSELMRWLLVLGLVLPIILVAISPDPSMYINYTTGGRSLYDRHAEKLFHILVGRACQLSLFAAAVLLYFAPHVVTRLVVLTPFVSAACWINGKRNAVAYAIMLGLYTLWRRGTLRGKRLLIVGVVTCSAFGAFSVYYQTKLRFSDTFVQRKDSHFWYENFRIDYGRDHVIKLAIFAELYPDKVQILDYRGKSALIMATLFIPRSLWPEKPPSYATHMSVQAMERLPMGGGVTTSVHDESIANAGIFGYLLAPLIIAGVCRIGDSCRDENTRMLTVMIAICLQVVHIAPWAPLAALWVVLVGREKILHSTLKPSSLPATTVWRPAKGG